MTRNAQHIVARNAIVLLVGNILTRLIGFLSIVLLTNYLDVDNFGRYNFLFAYAMLFTPLCDLGVDTFLVRDLAANPGNRGWLEGTALSLKTVLSLATIGVISISFSLFYKVNAFAMLMPVVAAVVAFRNLPVTISGIFRSDQRGGLDSTLQITAKTFDLLAVAAAILLRVDLSLLIQILLASALVQSLFAFVFARRNGFLRSLSFDRSRITSLLKGGFPFVLTSISVMIYFQIDAVMLSTFLGERETGLYRSATNIVFALNAFSAAIVAALFPMVAKHFKTDKDLAVRTASNAMSYSLLIALPIAIGATIVAPEIIHFLYKDTFSEASASLRILIWWVPVSFATNVLGHILGAIGLQRKVLTVCIINAAFNVLANLYFIPEYGAVGASIITVATEIVGLVIQTFIVTRNFGRVFQGSKLGKVGLATLTLLPLAFLPQTTHIGTSVGLAVVAYCAALFAVGILRRDELEHMKTILNLSHPDEKQ